MTTAAPPVTQNACTRWNRYCLYPFDLLPPPEVANDDDEDSDFEDGVPTGYEPHFVEEFQVYRRRIRDKNKRTRMEDEITMILQSNDEHGLFRYKARLTLGLEWQHFLYASNIKEQDWVTILVLGALKRYEHLQCFKWTSTGSPSSKVIQQLDKSRFLKTIDFNGKPHEDCKNRLFADLERLTIPFLQAVAISNIYDRSFEPEKGILPKDLFGRYVVPFITRHTHLNHVQYTYDQYHDYSMNFLHTIWPVATGVSPTTTRLSRLCLVGDVNGSPTDHSLFAEGFDKMLQHPAVKRMKCLWISLPHGIASTLKDVIRIRSSMALECLRLRLPDAKLCRVKGNWYTHLVELEVILPPTTSFDVMISFMTLDRDLHSNMLKSFKVECTQPDPPPQECFVFTEQVAWSICSKMPLLESLKIKGYFHTWRHLQVVAETLSRNLPNLESLVLEPIIIYEEDSPELHQRNLPETRSYNALGFYHDANVVTKQQRGEKIAKIWFGSSFSTHGADSRASRLIFNDQMFQKDVLTFERLVEYNIEHDDDDKPVVFDWTHSERVDAAKEIFGSLKIKTLVKVLNRNVVDATKVPFIWWSDPGFHQLGHYDLARQSVAGDSGQVSDTGEVE